MKKVLSLPSLGHLHPLANSSNKISIPLENNHNKVKRLAEKSPSHHMIHQAGFN
jgi:hypothetical protein